MDDFYYIIKLYLQKIVILLLQLVGCRKRMKPKPKPKPVFGFFKILDHFFRKPDFFKKTGFSTFELFKKKLHNMRGAAFALKFLSQQTYINLILNLNYIYFLYELSHNYYIIFMKIHMRIL